VLGWVGGTVKMGDMLMRIYTKKKTKKKKTKLKNLQEAVDGSRVAEMVVLKEELHNLLEYEQTRWL
jgi:hypothetical protein